MKRTRMARGTSQMKRSWIKPNRKPLKPRSTPEAGTIKKLEQTLDDLTRKVLREDERVSFTSGKAGTAADPLELSHLFGRAMRPTRFDVHPEGNCHMMTRSENQAHNNDKSIYQNEYIRRFGRDAYDDLDQRAHSNKQFTYLDLYRLIEQRETMLR